MGRENDKIKRDTLIGEYETGGLPIVDFDCYFKALKASWVPRLTDPVFRKGHLPAYLFIIIAISSYFLLFMITRDIYKHKPKLIEIERKSFNIQIDDDYLEQQWIYQIEDAAIVNAAKTIKSRPVMVSLINGAFFPFVFSWLCNTLDMGIHKQVLIIVTDEKSHIQLKSRWPDIKIAVTSVESTLKRAQTYSHVGYVRLCIRRTQILKALIDNDIDTFLFEFDSVWFRNPIPLFQSFSGKYDIVFSGVTSRPEAISGGLQYLFATNATKKVLLKWNAMLVQLETIIRKLDPDESISTKDNDQEYMSHLVNTSYAGFKAKIFPVSEIADGLWYALPAEVRVKQNIYLINFNWVVGSEDKIKRAKKWGHWFIRYNNSCDFERLRQVRNISEIE